MPGKFAQVMGNLGDAIAGVDREAAYREGQLQRNEIDQTEAQADAAMSQAMQRRHEAEVAEMEKEALRRVAAAESAALTDPNAAPFADLIVSKRGSDYSGVMSGRNSGQQYQQRELVGTPAGQELGDMIVTDEARQAAMDALSPASAIAMRRPRAAGAPVVVQDPTNPNETVLVPNTGGAPITVQTPNGPQPARPRARPSSAGSGPAPTNQQKNYKWMTEELGVNPEQALRIATNTDVDLVAVYQRGVTSADRFATEEEKQAAGLAAVEKALALVEPLLPPDDQGADGDLPEGSRLVGHTTSGAEVYATPDGQRFVVE